MVRRALEPSSNMAVHGALFSLIDAGHQQAAVMVPGVLPHNYTIWWPWLKNYSGEERVGYQARTWYNFVWLDQELKKSMGY